MRSPSLSVQGQGSDHQARPPFSPAPSSVASPKSRFSGKGSGTKKGSQKKRRHRAGKKKNKHKHDKDNDDDEKVDDTEHKDADEHDDNAASDTQAGERHIAVPSADNTCTPLNKLYEFINCRTLPKPAPADNSWSMMDALDGDMDALSCYSVKFSPCSTLIASGCEDAAVRIFSVKNGRQLACFVDPDQKNKVCLPITALAFNPGSRRKQLLVANACGSLTWWDCDGQKILHKYSEEESKEANGGSALQVLSLNYRADGKIFVTGDAECNVRVYDEETKQVVNEWGFSRRPDVKVTNHSGSIYSAKFHKKDENIVVTGGWDFCVKVWDVRQKEPIRSIVGPYIVGDSVDVVGRRELITGSYRLEDQIQVWDLLSGRLVHNIEWAKFHKSDSDSDIPKSEDCPLIYTLAVSECGKRMVAGGKSPHNLRLFTRQVKKEQDISRSSMFKPKGTDYLSGPVYTATIAPNSKLVAFGGKCPNVHLYKLAGQAAGV